MFPTLCFVPLVYALAAYGKIPASLHPQISKYYRQRTAVGDPSFTMQLRLVLPLLLLLQQQQRSM